ncbi:MAG: hypothetical protein FGM54_06535 [Chitinophagaceae bacterium]|nr:hypothetical protein [Chitinophagaceae bacterium]
MNLPAFNEAELAPYLNRADYFSACILQTEKDLSAYGIRLPLHFPGTYPLGELLHELQPQIKLGLNRGIPIHEILYRVDVPESLWHKAIQAFPGNPPEEIISRLIILRELQKVITRLSTQRASDSNEWLDV